MCAIVSLTRIASCDEFRSNDSVGAIRSQSRLRARVLISRAVFRWQQTADFAYRQAVAGPAMASALSPCALIYTDFSVINDDETVLSACTRLCLRL